MKLLPLLWFSDAITPAKHPIALLRTAVLGAVYGIVFASWMAATAESDLAPSFISEIALASPPEAQVSTTTLQFGHISYPNGVTLPLTVTNVGGGTLTVAPSINGPSYTVSGSTCTGGITAGDSCTLQVEFAPVAIGYHDDVLTLATNGSANPTVALQALATGVGAIETETPLQFGAIAFGATDVLPLTIYNYGVSGTVLVGTSINGPSYKVLTTPQNTCLAGISAGQTCILPVEFDPVAVGSHDDVLTLTPSDSAAPSTVKLSGVAGGVGTEMEAPLQFGTILFGTAETLMLTISNVGIPGTVTVGTSINGPSYKVLTTAQNTCLAGISPGQTCILPVEFDPVAVGSHDDVLTLTPSGGAAPSTVKLSGIASGVGTEMEAPLQFGTIPFGTAETLMLTISNVGIPGTVTVGTSINGPSYKVLTTAQNTCLAGISPGQTCILPVEFDPVAVGSHDDVLTLTPSGGADATTVALKGIASAAAGAPTLPQAETILYTFTGNGPGTADGWSPSGGLVMDSQGNLYGTTVNGGGSGDYGTVFKISSSGQETILYSFVTAPTAPLPTADW